MTFKQTHL